jgi:hypothetical protein
MNKSKLLSQDLEKSATQLRRYGDLVASMCYGNFSERTYIYKNKKFIVTKELGQVKSVSIN